MTGLLRLQVLGPGEGLHVSDEGGAAQGSRPCAPREDERGGGRRGWSGQRDGEKPASETEGFSARCV